MGQPKWSRNYVTQFSSINSVQRNLPTFGIFTEKRETLSDLVKFSVQILSEAYMYKYSTSDIIRKINMVMSDSTAHDFKIMEVCEDEGRC